MATTIEKLTGSNNRTWECKECHHSIAEQDTVAYHLVNGVLYGWCESCFGQRGCKNVSELAA